MSVAPGDSERHGNGRVRRRRRRVMMRVKIKLLAAGSLLLPAMAAAQDRAPTQNEIIEQARRDVRASEREAARNLDERRSLYEVRYRKAAESGDTAEAMRILEEMQVDQAVPVRSGPPGPLKIVFGPGFAGAVPVSPAKPVSKASPKKAPVAAGPKKKEEREDGGGSGPNPKLKRELEDALSQKRRQLDMILQRKELLPKDDIVLRRDFDKEADWARNEIRLAERRYTDYLQAREPGEYRRYIDQRRRIAENPLEARPGAMRDELWGNRAPPPHDVARQGPKTPALQEYDGPSGAESERRLEGGQNAYEADRVIAPGLNTSPGKAPSPQLHEYDGPQGPSGSLPGDAYGGDGPVLAPGLGNGAAGPKR
ncbi:MAG: hypothetical protein MT490_03545 [Sphingomonas sp.]|uniref:hypothetical protein n=1 Tax=Sphingomonas sp. TaxID=28214 RepID=UPI00227360CD|nr:hypothetical protein [Sphingomonas sp.]MCX8474851.1 hypothetical protein [Sphingomonas sp.]